MIVAIAANEQQINILQQKGFKEDVELIWVLTSPELYMQNKADVWIDCLYNGESLLANIDKPLLIHLPIDTLQEMKVSGTVARFCAWNSFLERKLWEIAIADQNKTGWLQELMGYLGWSYQVVKDEPGLVAPRIVSMIINEAYFAFSEGISSKEDINVAMKLGTNYPYGPFEWAAQIGHNHIYALLMKLAKKDLRYEPCRLIKNNY